MDNNKHNDPLDELFRKRAGLNGGQGSEGLDDFEREALEGFDTLSSSEEARDLKASLDVRMKEEVFAPKKNTRVYWLAAAALAVVMGLSVIFVMNNGDTKSNGLAISDKVATEAAPADMQKNVPAEGMPASEAEKVAEPGKKLEEPASKSEAVVAKEEKKQSVAVGETNKNYNEQSISAGKAGESQKMSGSGAALADAEEKRNEGVKTIVNNTSNDNSMNNQVPASVPNPSKDANLDADILKKESKEKDKGDIAEQKGKRDEPGNLAQTTAGYTKGPVDRRKEGEASQEDSKNAERSRKKSRSAKKNSAEPSIATENKPASGKLEDVAGNNRAEDESVAREQVTEPEELAVPKAADDKAKESPSFFDKRFAGGESAMKKELAAKLQAEKLNLKFDATLFVNREGTVEKVNIYNSYGMSNKDENGIEKVLRSMKFDRTDQKGLSEVKILHRP